MIWASDSSAIVISGTYLPLDVLDLAEREVRKSTKLVVEVKIPSREVIPITSRNIKLLNWDSGAGKLLGRELEGRPGKLLEYRKNSADWKEVEVNERGPDNALKIEINALGGTTFVARWSVPSGPAPIIESPPP